MCRNQHRDRVRHPDVLRGGEARSRREEVEDMIQRAGSGTKSVEFSLGRARETLEEL